MKRLLKLLLYLLLALLVLYLVFVFAFGGFGKRTSTDVSCRIRGKTLLFGHRGISLYYPENSREGVQGARVHGFHACEVDIRRSAEGENILFHDETGERLLRVGQGIDAMNLAEIRKHPIVLRSGQTSTAVVPTVDELLSAQKKEMCFYFDMKFSSFKDADDIVKLIKQHGCERYVIVANWDISFIFYVEAKYPEIITALEGFDAGKEWAYSLMPKNLKPDFLSGFYSHTSTEHVDWLKKQGLMESRIVYGVDSTNYTKALKAGFMNILIDYDSAMNKDPLITGLLKN